jgi:broad specificity phosphatase PhoE
MMLYFLRHGESEANAAGVYAHFDTPLTTHGREEAALAGQAAKDLDIQAIISSDQPRAAETARIVAAAIGFAKERIEPDSRLEELKVGNLMGTPTKGVEGYFEHQANPGSDDLVEPFADAESRIRDFIKSLKTRPEQVVLVVGHIGSGRLLRGLLLGDDRNLEQTPVINNAELTLFPDPNSDEVQA